MILLHNRDINELIEGILKTVASHHSNINNLSASFVINMSIKLRFLEKNRTEGFKLHILFDQKG